MKLRVGNVYSDKELQEFFPFDLDQFSSYKIKTIINLFSGDSKPSKIPYWIKLEKVWTGEFKVLDFRRNWIGN